jgi:hypothetical protein
MHHSQMVNNDMGNNGVQLPMSGVVPLAEPPAKRQKTVNLQVDVYCSRARLWEADRLVQSWVLNLSVSRWHLAVDAYSGLFRSSTVYLCQSQENAGTSLLEAFSVKEIDTHLASLSISPQVFCLASCSELLSPC